MHEFERHLISTTSFITTLLVHYMHYKLQDTFSELSLRTNNYIHRYAMKINELEILMDIFLTSVRLK
jgi:hypothetical protein